MDCHVSLAGAGDLSARIYRQLHEAIVDGRLGPGERVPPSRELAARLSVARNTVAVAYDRLVAEGFLVGRVGSGTFVCVRPPVRGGRPDAAAGDEIPVRSVWEACGESGVDATVPEFDFRLGVPDVRRFPMATWRRLVARELRELDPVAAGYGDPAGHSGLRAAIARHIGLSRSVLVGADDVVVTHGAQQALDLIGRVLVAPGDRVAVEEPGYPPARELFATFGARVVGVPVDGEGLVVRSMPRNVRLVYTTPSHQFPLGTPMSLRRRADLLEWAHRSGAVVIEDDYDTEFRFSERPLEPLHSLDRGRRVVYVGSFAKTMLPVLRLGFLVVPRSVREAVRAAKRLTDRQGDPAVQGAMAAFLTEGHFTRHLRRSTREYAARHERILAVLRRDFGDRLDVVPSTAGLHLAAWARAPLDVDALVARAAGAGVAVESLGTYHGFGAAEPGLAIGYGAIDLERIEPGFASPRRVLVVTYGRSMTTAGTDDTTDHELDSVLAAAVSAHAQFADLTPGDRAHALRRVADVLDAAIGDLVPVANRETGLPVEPRLAGELGRTTFQLRLLAEAVVEGGYLEATLDSPDPDWPPAERPDVRRMLRPIGPVVVFAAGNFPFAFSVAGGDTGAALAVGCPVVVKAHPGHLALSELTASLVSDALASCGLPAGAFAVVYGDRAGRAAVVDPRIKAGAFTGSTSGGRALFALASSRADPIPFYAEMGSVNPVFVTGSAARNRIEDIADGYLGSFTLGVGQFCTKPGLLFVPAEAAPVVEERLVGAIANHAAGRMLNARTAEGYARILTTLTGHPAVRVLAEGVDSEDGPAPTLLGVNAADLLAHQADLVVECFGPVSIVVTYASEDELVACARVFAGELTATVHGERDDPVTSVLVTQLAERAGRVLWNGWPTGVAVTYAMHHGGPYPATTSPLHTSVGTTSLRRFLRPVAYQNMPQHLLPDALRDGNPLGIPRRVDGVHTVAR